MVERMDHPNVGLFVKHADAVAEADRRAALTRRRYRVRYDAANRWWQITELIGKVEKLRRS